MDVTLLQPVQALAFVYGGAVIGLLYDVTALLQRAFPGRVAGAVLDGLFALCMCAVFAAALLLANGGELRLFAFLAAALGFLWERAGLSYGLRRFFSKRFHKSRVK